MAMLPVHPAPGLGDLMTGFFVVPQNPIRDAELSTPIVASKTAKASGAVVKIPSLGDLLPGMFVVPQNPLRNALATPAGAGVPGTKPNTGSGMPALAGLGCSSCGNGLMGLGQTESSLMTSLSSATTGITSWLQQPSFISASIPNWGMVAGLAAAYFLFMPGGSAYRQQSASLRSQHRGYRRLASAVASS